jgi:hypothetical protein
MLMFVFLIWRNSCTSADITAFFKGMQVVPDGIFLCTHTDGRPTGEVSVCSLSFLVDLPCILGSSKPCTIDCAT